jgi:hypothetical protein
VSRAGWVAVPATLMSVVAMILFALGLPYLAFPVFAALYALIAVLTR